MLLHGILDYICCSQISIVEIRNLEVLCVFDKLTPVENLNIEPIDSRQATPLAEDLIPSPNNPPWNGWTAAGVWLFSVLAIIIFPGIFVLPYILSRAGQFADQQLLVEFATNDPTAIFLQILAVIPAHIFTLLAAWLVVTKMRRYSFRQTLGWESGGFKWWHYAAILLIFFAFAAIVGIYFPPQDTQLDRILKSSRAVVFVVAFMATFTAPLVEEVVYRGVLYSAFQRTFGVPAAVLLVTAIFAAVHVPQYMESLPTIFMLVLLSLILTLIRTKTKNLLPCIILHTIFNGLQSAMLILEPYLPQTVPVPDASTIFHLLR